MTEFFRVDSIKESSGAYFPGMEKYVGSVLKVNVEAPKLKGLTALFTLDSIDWCYFEDVGLTQVGDDLKKSSVLDKQVSGTHYKDCGIQPIEYIHANGLNYFEGNAVKYITRHRKKNGKADIEKAIHYLELMLELEYKEEK